MAGKTLEYDLKVLDKSKSMQQRTKDAKEYNNELSRSEKLMQQSRRAAYKQESVDYGATRALAMGTGASGRDFAKEAQGLGGLVRLYATFAANIFAVTAAFQQLSKAMDTTNMVRGMEQLGAQSGIALVNISKNLVATTDYAISMREAMEATAMATSAGLSAQQLQDVGLVAKNVSQALGRDVVDSITRLTRGIVKLEPELLDELGLFTKIGPATEKYALSIGKSASQLTDFERRQAFANAVIKEGLDKFSSIKLESNPYSKLLATLKDVAQAGLELINKVLTPVIKLLSESPTALAAILAGIAVTLTRQALPAIANFNQSMRDSAKDAVEAATKRALEVEKVLKTEVANRIARADQGAEYESMRWEKGTTVLMTLAKDRQEKLAKASRSAEAKAILGKAISEVTPDDLKKLDELAKRGSGVSKIYGELANSVRKYNQELISLDQQRKAAEEFFKSQQSLLTTTGRLLYQVQQENQRARSAEITANAAATTSLLGLRAAWSQLNDDIAKARKGPQVKVIEELDDAGKKTGKTFEYTINQMSAFQAAYTRTVGGIKILTQYVASAIGFLGIWGQAIALVGLAVGGLYSYFATATRELEKFDKTVDKHKGNLDSYKNTIDAIYAKPIDKIFGSASISAQANAVDALGQSLRELRNDVDKAWAAVERGNPLEKFWEGLKTLVGQNIDQKARRLISDTVVAQIKEAERSFSGKDVLQKFGDILGIEDPANNLEQVAKKIKNLDPSSRTLDRLADAWDKYSANLKQAQREQENFNELLKKTEESFQRFMQQYTINDPLTRFVLDATKSMAEFSKILDKPNIEENLSGILTLLDKINSIPFFSPEQMVEIDSSSKSIRFLNEAIGQSSKSLDKLKDERAALEKDLYKTTGVVGQKPIIDQQQLRKIEALDIRMADERVKIQGYSEQIKAESNKFLSQIPQALVNYGQKFTAIVAAELNKGATLYRQAVLSRAEEFLPEAAKEIANLKNVEIDTQISLIKSNLDLIKAIKLSDVERRLIELERQKSDKENILAQMAIFGVEGGPLADKIGKDLEELAKSIQSATLERGGIQTIFARPGTNVANLAKAGGLNASAAANLLETQAQVAGAMGQVNQLSRQKQVNVLEGENKELEANIALRERINGLVNKQLNLQDENIAILVRNQGVEKDVAEEKEDSIKYSAALRDLSIELAQISNSRLIYEKNYNDLLKAGLVDSAEKYQANYKQALALQTQNAQTTFQNKQLDIQLGTTNRILQRQYDINRAKAESAIRIDQIGRENTQNELDTRSQIFDLLVERGVVSAQEAQDGRRTLETQRALLETEIRLASIRDKQRLDEMAVGRQLETKQITDDEAKARLQNIREEALAESAAAIKSRDNKLQVIGLQNTLNTTQLRYLDLLKSTTDGLTDAIVQFAKGSKTAFKDFIMEALAGLLRLQLQLAIIEPMKQSLISTFFPQLVKSAGTTASAATSTPFYLPGAAAKGALFTSSSAMFAGMDKYAKGGLLNSPTLFAHSGGSRMAVAGEAGPEFVMPAVKTSNGSFGVRATGGKTEINIYNNTQANVEAKETVDSRGNRSFDVIISEMVAGNMAQSGSSMQNSLRGNYGLRPALVRR